MIYLLFGVPIGIKSVLVRTEGIVSPISYFVNRKMGLKEMIYSNKLNL